MAPQAKKTPPKGGKQQTATAEPPPPGGEADYGGGAPQPEPDRSHQQVALVSPPRIPYWPGLQAEFGIDRFTWRALIDSTFPSAQTFDGVMLAVSYCRARQLDILKRPVHVVPVWSKKANNGQGGYVETVWPGINETRTTADRTGRYAGADETVFGDWVEQEFVGQKDLWSGPRGNRKKVGVEKVGPFKVRFPSWARVTVYKMVRGQRCAFVGPKVFWLEAYGQLQGIEVPNERWRRAPSQMLEKCAEAAALRKAFPEEAGGTPTADEIEGQSFDPEDVLPVDEEAVAKPARPRRSDYPPVGDAPQVIDTEVEEVQERPEGQANGATRPKPAEEAKPDLLWDFADSLGELHECKNEADFVDRLVQALVQTRSQKAVDTLQENNAMFFEQMTKANADMVAAEVAAARERIAKASAQAPAEEKPIARPPVVEEGFNASRASIAIASEAGKLVTVEEIDALLAREANTVAAIKNLNQQAFVGMMSRIDGRKKILLREKAGGNQT